jgi:hypothetical protein
MDCSILADIEESLVMDFELARTARGAFCRSLLILGVKFCNGRRSTPTTKTSASSHYDVHARVESPAAGRKKRPHAAPRATEATDCLEA